MSCIPNRPCKSQSPSTFHEYLHKARDACYWVGHFNDPPMPTEEFDDWLMIANSEAPQSCSYDVGYQTCPFVDVFFYMVLKARQAAAAMAMIMLSAIVIALWSAQFIHGRWSRTLRSNNSVSFINLCFQATTLCILNVFVLFAVYWPAYHAFLSITGVVAWIVTMLKVAEPSV